MPDRIEKLDGAPIQILSLADQIPLLDLSSTRARIPRGEASTLVGIDVAARGKFQTERVKKAIGDSIPVSDRPITSVIEINAESSVLSETVGLFGVATRSAGGVVETYDSDPFVYLADLTFDSVEPTYDPATGIVNRTGAFTEYIFREGDVLMALTPIIKGIHRVLSRTDDDNIVIPRGLTGSSGSFVGMLPQGRGYFLRTFAGFQSTGEEAFVKMPQTYFEEGPWPDDMVGSILEVNPDGRESKVVQFRIKRLSSFSQKNDSLITEDVLTSGSAPIAQALTHKFRSVFLKAQKNLRQGVLVSNGRKFWLFSGGSYEEVMDLGDDIFLGSVWKGSRISSSRFMLTTPKFPPRIFTIDSSGIASGDDSTLAGLMRPGKPPSIEFVQNTFGRLGLSSPNNVVRHASWLMAVEASGGTLDIGTYKVLVRAVNPTLGLESEFLLCVRGDLIKDTSETTKNVLAQPAGNNPEITTSNATDGIIVFPSTNSGEAGSSEEDTDFWAPFLPQRMTHLEVWRTQSGGSTFYLETRLLIADIEIGQEKFQSTVPTKDIRGLFQAEGLTATTTQPIELPDAVLAGLPILTVEEEAGGGLPPICRDVVSLNDVTFCFGKADDDAVEPVVFARNFYMNPIRAFVDVKVSVPAPASVDTDLEIFTNYVFREGDQLVVTHGGSSFIHGIGIPEGVYDIASKNGPDKIFLARVLPIMNTSSDPFFLADVKTGGADLGARGYIRRPLTWDWPVVGSDEDVWFSRTDKFAPESFPARIRTLSRRGDLYRKAHQVLSSIVVVMDQAVHLLFINPNTPTDGNSNVVQDTIAEVGAGSPWENSVLLYEDSVYWATPDGIRRLEVFVRPDRDNRRAKLHPLIDLRFGDWFSEALANGDELDGAVDAANGLLRFRRKKADHTFETLVLSLRTQKITIIEDDAGLRYASSRHVETVVAGEDELYTFEGNTGAVFKVRDASLSLPYEGFTVEGLLKDLTVTAVSIRSPLNIFSPNMVGEIIKFDGTPRTILTASATELTFDPLAGLGLFKGYTIGAMVVRVRWAPYQGTRPTEIKQVRSLTLRLTPLEGVDSPDVTLRLYKDFEESSDNTDTIKVIDESGGGFSSRNRVSSIRGEGIALELELESLDAAKNFEIELVELGVLEDATDVEVPGE